jgi:hypothetical protein
MKLPLENKHVERILSLLIILYGLRLIIPNVLEFILCMQDADYMSWAIDALTHIIGGCLLIVFFANIVQTIGFFATKGTNRQERRWYLDEIFAVPLIFFVFTEFFYVLFYGVFSIAIIFYPYEFWGIMDCWNNSLFRSLSMLFALSIAIAILFYVRCIAAWLLWLVER